MSSKKIVWFGILACAASLANVVSARIRSLLRMPARAGRAALAPLRRLRWRQARPWTAGAVIWAVACFALLAIFSSSFKPVQAPAAAIVSMQRAEAFILSLRQAGLLWHVGTCAQDSSPWEGAAPVKISQKMAQGCAETARSIASELAQPWIIDMFGLDKLQRGREEARLLALAAAMDFDDAIDSAGASLPASMSWAAATAFGVKDVLAPSEMARQAGESIRFEFFSLWLAGAFFAGLVAMTIPSGRAEKLDAQALHASKARLQANMAQAGRWSAVFAAVWACGALIFGVGQMTRVAPVALSVVPLELVEQTCSRLPPGSAHECDAHWNGQWAQRAHNGRVGLTSDEIGKLQALSSYAGPNSLLQTVADISTPRWPLLDALSASKSLGSPSTKSGLDLVPAFVIDQQHVDRWPGAKATSHFVSYLLLKQDQAKAFGAQSPAERMLSLSQKASREEASQALAARWGQASPFQTMSLWSAAIGAPDDPARSQAVRQLRVYPLAIDSLLWGWMVGAVLGGLAVGMGIFLFGQLRKAGQAAAGARQTALRSLESRGAALAAEVEKRELDKLSRAVAPKPAPKNNSRL